MRHEGTARLDRRTKNLVTRLTPSDIAVVDHADMDRVSAEQLIECGVEVVVNAAPFISGAYPNSGPLLLARAGVTLLDDVGCEIFDRVSEGDPLVIEGDAVVLGGDVVARGQRLSVEAIEERMTAAADSLDERLDEFARNTLEYLDREKGILTGLVHVPTLKVDIRDRHALVVVRGYDYREDLAILRSYIREVRPVLIGVDGGADAILESGFKPDVIVGDMDSVSDQALRCGAELVVHAYTDGRAPGMERLASLGLDGIPWPMTGTSEDLGLLLPYEKGAELIVAVGTHANLVEYLDKGRDGMASTFLVRLKVGRRLVDAKGVSKLYRGTIGPRHLLVLVLAALATVSAIVLISPVSRSLVALVILRIRTLLGI